MTYGDTYTLPNILPLDDRTLAPSNCFGALSPVSKPEPQVPRIRDGCKPRDIEVSIKAPDLDIVTDEPMEFGYPGVS